MEDVGNAMQCPPQEQDQTVKHLSVWKCRSTIRSLCSSFGWGHRKKKECAPQCFRAPLSCSALWWVSAAHLSWLTQEIPAANAAAFRNKLPGVLPVSPLSWSRKKAASSDSKKPLCPWDTFFEPWFLGSNDVPAFLYFGSYSAVVSSSLRFVALRCCATWTLISRVDNLEGIENELQISVIPKFSNVVLPFLHSQACVFAVHGMAMDFVKDGGQHPVGKDRLGFVIGFVKRPKRSIGVLWYRENCCHIWKIFGGGIWGLVSKMPLR